MDYKDYYKILDIDKTADAAAIKKQYRRLARKYHPDVSKEENAEEKFKEVKEAYEVLSDPEKRKAYDTLGPNWQQGQGGFEPPPGWDPNGFQQSQHFSDADAAGFSDFFESIFGQRGGAGGGFHRQQHGGFQQKGQDFNTKIFINLEDAYNGVERQFTLQVPEVNAQGQVVNKTKTLKVKIPKGVMKGQQIRLAGQGGPGMGGAPNGDLYLEIAFQEHANFSLDGKDVYTTVPITPWEAALGASITASTPAGKLNVKIPADSQSGKKLRLKGKGLPAKTPGDQYLVLEIVVPKADTEEKKKFYEEMKAKMDFDPR